MNKQPTVGAQDIKHHTRLWYSFPCISTGGGLYFKRLPNFFLRFYVFYFLLLPASAHNRLVSEHSPRRRLCCGLPIVTFLALLPFLARCIGVVGMAETPLAGVAPNSSPN
jgi:hypothetical protein